MKSGLIEIKNDTFNVVDRLKAIDSDYVVFFNKRLNRFELHTANGRGTVLSLVLPYSSLDVRAVNLALYTRRERSEKLYAEIENSNRKAEQKRVNDVIERAVEEMSKIKVK